MEEMIFYFIISAVALLLRMLFGFIPGLIAKRKGYSFILCWLYGCLLFIIATIHVSLLPDKNVQQIPVRSNNISNCPPQNSEQRTMEMLKKYKELFDQGAITEAEFQAKKDQLLKLM